MKSKITAFLNELMLYDYILFGSVFALFILILILALVLRKKTAVSLFLALLSFIILFLGPTLGYIKMHEYLFANSIKLLSQKQLTFTPALIVKGQLTNISKRNFHRCKITASIIKQGKNKYKNYIYQFKPLKKMSIVEQDIRRSQVRDFKIIVEPFSYSKDYNITLKADCR